MSRIKKLWWINMDSYLWAQINKKFFSNRFPCPLQIKIEGEKQMYNLISVTSFYLLVAAATGSSLYYISRSRNSFESFISYIFFIHYRIKIEEGKSWQASKSVIFYLYCSFNCLWLIIINLILIFEKKFLSFLPPISRWFEQEISSNRLSLLSPSYY